MAKRVEVGDQVIVRLGHDGYEEFVLAPDVDLEREVVLDPNRERITQAWIDRKVEALRQERAQRSGRPSLTGPSKHSPHISFRVPEQLAERAERLAAREGKSISELGREALERYIEQAG